MSVFTTVLQKCAILSAMQRQPQVQLQLNTRLVPALVGLLVVMQLIVPYRGWLILLIGLGGLWLICYLWAKSLATGLQLRREMRFDWAQVGDQLEERFTLTSEGWTAPGLWVEVIDHSTVPGYQPSRVSGISSRSESRWQTQLVCSRRGLFRLGPTTVRTGDPFGLYTVSLHYPESTTLTVTPPIIPLLAIEVAPGGRAGEGRPQPDALERTVSAASVREYLPGDSLRVIHWPTSARRGSLYSRLLEGTPAGDWWIFLDLNGEVQVGQGQNSTEEHSVILAASLASQGLQAGRNVGLVCHGQELVWLPPEAGDIRLWAILRALALVTPGQRSLAELLLRVRPAFGQLASLVIITPDTSSQWLEAMVPLLRRGVVATVLLLDPVSFGANRDLAGSIALLAELGISHYTITRDMLDRPEARPGKRGQWEWRVSPSGRAVAVRRPRDTAWRRLV